MRGLGQYSIIDTRHLRRRTLSDTVRTFSSQYRFSNRWLSVPLASKKDDAIGEECQQGDTDAFSFVVLMRPRISRFRHIFDLLGPLESWAPPSNARRPDQTVRGTTSFTYRAVINGLIEFIRLSLFSLSPP